MEKVIPDIVKRINLHYRRISVSEHERGSGRRKKTGATRELKDALREIKRLVDSVTELAEPFYSTR